MRLTLIIICNKRKPSINYKPVPKLQTFSEQLSTYEQRLNTLNDLFNDLVQHHHRNDDSRDLQETVRYLNETWKRMRERSVV